MGTAFGSRTLAAVCAVMLVLLAALAAVQYQWSTRVAAADAQREREHLEAAAALFAGEFNGIAGQAVTFLHQDASTALRAGEKLTGLPKLFAGLYYIDGSEPGRRTAQRLTVKGTFEPAALPEWVPNSCAQTAVRDPAAVLLPIFDVATSEDHGGAETRILKTMRLRLGRCFAALLDEKYLRETLFPQLIRGSFGETSAREYDFAVVWRGKAKPAIYGAALQPDVSRPFFMMLPLPLPLPGKQTSGRPPQAVIFQRFDGAATPAKDAPHIDDLFVSGIWDLEVAHKGMPLAAAFEQRRRRDVLLSIAVEVLLIAAMVFLVIGARRMQRLAEQKMQFVAGVSHELRTPISAISMLSRNQADGLVAGTDKVKQYGELIHQQSRRLNEMLEQTLHYAGIHSGLGGWSRDEVDLTRLIQEAVSERQEELGRAGFEIELALSPDLPRVTGDAKLLRIAVDNLLSNAQKHAEAGRWMRVSARYSAAEKEVQISVEDRGAGIAAADQTEIFEPFARGRAAVEAQIPGSGLGLSLVRSAAEAHRGNVTLVSEPGRGSTFTLHLPV